MQLREPDLNHAGPDRANDTNKPMIYKLAAALHWLILRLKGHNRYRPERHYMRGPGPKARAMAAAHDRG